MIRMRKVLSLLVVGVFVFLFVGCHTEGRLGLELESETDEILFLDYESKNYDYEQSDLEDIAYLERELDFRSILDTRTDTVFSLGDAKAYFDRVLGPGVGGTDEGIYRVYGYGNLLVFFLDGIAVEFVYRDVGRFEFGYMSFDITEKDLDENFHLVFHSPGDVTVYHGYYDSEGNSTSREMASYYSRIAFADWGDWTSVTLMISSRVEVND